MLLFGSFFEITKLHAFLIAVLLLPSKIYFTNPIPHKYFKPYGKRSLVKNILIFGLLPLISVYLMFILLGFFDVGK